MSVTIMSGQHKAIWDDGELSGSSKLVKTLQAAERANLHRGVDLLPTGPVWDITLADARGTAALATYLNLSWHSDEIDLGEGCLPEYDTPESIRFWAQPKPRVGKTLGLVKHLAGTADDHDQGTHNPHKHVSSQSGKEGVLYDPSSPWEGMMEYLDAEEVATTVFEGTLELPDGSRYQASVKRAEDISGMIEVHGVIESEDGDPVGTFDRVLYPNGNVTNVSFHIEEEFRHRGIGTMFASHWEDELAAAGYHTISLEAGGLLGAYTWAIAGYQFKDAEAREKAKAGWKYLWKDLDNYGWDVPVELQEEVDRVFSNPNVTPLEIALIGYDHKLRLPAFRGRGIDKMHLGKAILLASYGWWGKKALTVAKSLDAAREVWKEYARTSPDLVEADDPDFLAELADALNGKVSKGLSPNFGKRNRRQANLMSRLRGSRNYATPVRGGTGAQRRTRRSKFAKGLGLEPIEKHTPGGKDHDQSKHGNRYGTYERTEILERTEPAPPRSSATPPGTRAEVVAGKRVQYRTYFSDEARHILDTFLATERGKRLWDAAGPIKVVFRDRSTPEAGNRDSLFQVGVFIRADRTLEVSLYAPQLQSQGVEALREAGPFSSLDLQEGKHFDYLRRSNEDITSTLAHELAHAVDFQASDNNIPQSANQVNIDAVSGFDRAETDLDSVVRYLRPSFYRSLTPTQAKEWAYAQRTLMLSAERGVVETFAVATEMWWRGKNARLRALVKSANTENQNNAFNPTPDFDPDTLVNWVESTLRRAEENVASDKKEFREAMGLPEDWKSKWD